MYALGGTQKFEVPVEDTSLDVVFQRLTASKDNLKIRDWGIANTTLEEVFIKIARTEEISA